MIAKSKRATYFYKGLAAGKTFTIGGRTFFYENEKNTKLRDLKGVVWHSKRTHLNNRIHFLNAYNGGKIDEVK